MLLMLIEMVGQKAQHIHVLGIFKGESTPTLSKLTGVNEILREGAVYYHDTFHDLAQDCFFYQRFLDIFVFLTGNASKTL